MCKNLEYISLLQSRAMLAEPSKMHRNRPLAVHPATIVLFKLFLYFKVHVNRSLSISSYAFIVDNSLYS